MAVGSVSIIEKLKIGISKKSKAKQMEELVARCQQGDPAAFKQLFDKHINGVQRHLALLVGPGEDVDDLVQLVFLNVFQSIGRFQGLSSFSTWLFRITINVARQEIRLKTRYRKLDKAVHEASKVKDGLTSSNPESTMSNWQQIYDTLDKISAKKRETFILYTYEGYSLQEIAVMLNSSVSTIGSRLQAARKEILDSLAGELR